MIDLPEGSIYFSMYTWGLKGIPLDEIQSACNAAGVQIRDKDLENYYNGLRNHRTMFRSEDPFVIAGRTSNKSESYESMRLIDYPENPDIMLPDVTRRWVPCNKNNKPMCKWSKEMYSLVDARAKLGSVYVGENLRGGKYIVIDCDGDHDKDNIDEDLIRTMWKYSKLTHTLSKPDSFLLTDDGDEIPVSYHLTFWTDRIIPTMHFQHCHIDICGNKENQLRYWKNKIWNGKDPAEMTPEIWEDIKLYIQGRR